MRTCFVSLFFSSFLLFLCVISGFSCILLQYFPFVCLRTIKLAPLCHIYVQILLNEIKMKIHPDQIPQCDRRSSSVALAKHFTHKRILLLNTLNVQTLCSVWTILCRSRKIKLLCAKKHKVKLVFAGHIFDSIDHLTNKVKQFRARCTSKLEFSYVFLKHGKRMYFVPMNFLLLKQPNYPFWHEKSSYIRINAKCQWKKTKTFQEFRIVF